MERKRLAWVTPFTAKKLNCSAKPPSKISCGAGSRYIQGMGKIDGEVKMILNVERLLYGEELEENYKPPDQKAADEYKTELKGK